MEEQFSDGYCTCEIPSWAAGMCVVRDEDVRDVYNSGRKVVCQVCDGAYHPDYSFDIYA